jgi:hypothetical protein
LQAEVGQPAHNPPFSIVGGGGAVTIAPKSSRSVTVRFAPTEKGTTDDQISITSNDPTQTKPIIVKLKGKAKESKR